MTEIARPRPEITDVNRAFWQAAADHRLVIQHCQRCDRFQHEPVVLCPGCGGEMEWRDGSGEGRLHSFTIMHQVYHPYFADIVPYNVAVVELKEGPLMLSSIIGCDSAALRIGMPVEIRFLDIDEGLSLPMFAPNEVAHG